MSSTPYPNRYLVESFDRPPPGAGDQGPAVGSADWLLNVIAYHARAEAAALAEYEHLATASGDPVVAFVMRMILDDEERHHHLLNRMAASLRDALDGTQSPQALPTTPVSSEGSPELAALARKLIDEEHGHVKQMRSLARSEKQIGEGLDALLLEVMARDSEKHAWLLQFVAQRLEGHTRH